MGRTALPGMWTIATIHGTDTGDPCLSAVRQRLAASMAMNPAMAEETRHRKHTMLEENTRRDFLDVAVQAADVGSN